MLVSERLRKSFKYRKKWLTLKGIWNVLLFSGAILVIATIFEMATIIVTSNLPSLEKGFYIIFWWLVLSGFILIYAMVSPDLMDTVFQMLGFKQEESKKEEKPSDTNKTSVTSEEK